MKWYVISPPWEHIPGDTFEPPEIGCDVVEVEAPTRTKAKALGLAAMRRMGRSYVNEYQDGCPFKGLDVVPIEEASHDAQ